MGKTAASGYADGRGEYFGARDFRVGGSMPYISGHSENVRSLGPTGAEIWPFTSHHHKNSHISAPGGPRDLKFSL